MTIKEYKELVKTTNEYVKTDRALLKEINEIIEISTLMGYKKALETVGMVLKTYATVEKVKAGENIYSYVAFNAPLDIREKILNLRYHVENQQECDFSEKVLNLR